MTKQAFVTDLHDAARRRPSSSRNPTKPRGEAAKAFAAADIRHEAEYFIPTEHHNPMEMYASTVIWEGDGKLTVYDKTQGAQNVQRYLCSVFGLKADDVRVMSPFVGGAFGSGLRPQYQLFLAVLAALELERSVRVVLTRQQMFTLGYRPRTIQTRARSAPTPDGTLDAIIHEAISGDLALRGLLQQRHAAGRRMLYTCDNVRAVHKLAQLDVPTPCDMRAPGAATGVFALECAMDELAVALKLDPARAAAAQLFRSRPERGHALYQQGAARMLPQGAEALRLGQAHAAAALDARRQRAGRLGHGDGRLGGAADADGARASC